MIDQFLKDAKVLNPNISGVQNVVQSVEPDDILLVPVIDQIRLESILERNLPQTFKGVLVCPSPQKVYSKCLIRSLEEIKLLESELVNFYFPTPSKEIPIIGVTGTNGKTSVTWLFSEISKSVGKRILISGTAGVFIAGDQYPDNVATTTPSYLALRKLLHKYGNEIDGVALEVSSHALKQNRLKNIKLSFSAWTNFTQDHLDYHETMEDYFSAKLMIRDISENKKIIIHADENDLVEKVGREKVQLVNFKEIENIPPLYKEGFLKKNFELALSIYSKCFNEKPDFTNVTLPPGRFQIVKHKGRTFVVDYAHTPDALENVLGQIRNSFPKSKILTIFGCGGNRDKKKRPLMATAAESCSDYLIITSDNPRDEDPLTIIEEASLGIKYISFEKIVDRKSAIQKAFQITDQGWVILIAGKGHENTQEIKGKKFKFSDYEEILSC